MSRLDTAAPVSVRVGDCECAGTPHDGQDGRDDGDIVYLRKSLTLDAGLAAYAAMFNAGGDTVRATTAAQMTLVEYGVTGWNFLDDAGVPIPVTPENIRTALTFEAGGYAVAQKAEELYGETVAAPLALLTSTPSRNGQTGRSTSPNRASRRHPPKPSA